MLPPSRHYTDEPAHLCASVTDDERGFAVTCVRGGGFVTEAMLAEALDRLVGGDTSQLLIDLREVAGYEAGCVSVAHRWLVHAHRSGVRKIAFVATSSVFQTAARVAAERSHLALRAFAYEDPAWAWLRETADIRSAPQREWPSAAEVSVAATGGGSC